MKTFETYNKEIRKNIIEHWSKSGHNEKDMENDPVINLLLSAISYQAYHIQKNVEQFEEKTIRELQSRTAPYHLTKPVPAFSIMEVALKEGCKEKIMDETCAFEFLNNKKQKIAFTPLLNTKIINAKLSMVECLNDNVWNVEIESKENIDSLNGVSFYIDSAEHIEIEKIKYLDTELPLIKPTQYSELPFIEWFNNAHIFLNQNYYLFGTYDYWRELFLTQSEKWYCIGAGGKEILCKNETRIKLEITFNSALPTVEILKINCIPVVNVEKKEISLDERAPVKNLTSETGNFLNLLCNKNNETDFDTFFIRQHSVERYNTEQLFEQIQEMLYRYKSDYYAFQNVKELSSLNFMEQLEDIMDDFRNIVNKLDDKMVSGHYYAILKKTRETKKVDFSYLVTAGALGNEIKPFAKPTKMPAGIDNNKSHLLTETQGGRNTIKDETQKEAIAKYFHQTKDRLVTPADITVFIKTFYYNEMILGNEIENISVIREKEHIHINILLKIESELKNSAKNELLSQILKNKIELRTSGVLPFNITLY